MGGLANDDIEKVQLNARNSSSKVSNLLKMNRNYGRGDRFTMKLECRVRIPKVE